VKRMNLLRMILLFVLISSGSAAAKPNILFIAIDDLNDYISPLDNHPGIKTPNFERLAKRSVTFTNAHCAAPACHPSRVAVMTGVHPSKSGIYQNAFGAHGPRWRQESPVLANAVVLSQHFRDHGYRAVGGGKIFHTLQWTPGDSQNDPDAWDAYRGDPLDPISGDWPRPASARTNQNAGFKGKRPLNAHLFGAAPVELAADQGDGAVVDWAVEQMGKPDDKPLFLAVGLFRPHIPWEVPQKWFDLYPEEDVKLPAILANDLDDARSHGREGWHKWVVQNDQWRHLMRGYLASVSYADDQLGRLLDGLDASPMAGNTIVVLWTDHGFHIGEKENWEKFALWEQTTRTPLFIHAPGVSKDGERTRQPVTLTDLYPTLCELVGIPVPAQCTGGSLVEQIREPSAIDERTSLTSFVFHQDNRIPSHAVSDAKYRFIKYADGFEELYDLDKDRGEFTNLAKDPSFAEVSAKLRQRIPVNAEKQVINPKRETTNMLFVDNGTVKVGIERAKGGAITHLSWAECRKNVVNSHDPGRLIQQSYYAGRTLDRKGDGQHEAWSPWNWNPIQGGGVGSWAKVNAFKRLNGQSILYSETIPKLWDMPDEDAAALMRQRTGFEPEMPNVIVVDCELVSMRELNDRWGDMTRSPQEIPACYFARKFDTFKSYLGEGNWRAEPENKGTPWRHATVPRGAMACFAKDGQGIAVFSPSAKVWNFGPHGEGDSEDPLADPCVHIAPVDLVEIGPKSTLKYRYWLLVGTETQIAQQLDTLWQKYSSERVEVK
jgi:arylsulfatase A-like enzyme